MAIEIVSCAWRNQSRLQDEFPVWMDVTELNALNKLDEEEGRDVPKFTESKRDSTSDLTDPAWATNPGLWTLDSGLHLRIRFYEPWTNVNNSRYG